MCCDDDGLTHTRSPFLLLTRFRKNVLEFLQTAEEGCELGSLVDIHGSFKETVDSEANYSWRADPNRDFGSHWVSGSSQIKSAKQIMESFCKNIKTRDPIPRK
mmetsp:Transcript_5291/g.15932  ORF Transcript_5291/g.15932 Transcript_5291/m.15932 type:complete len:103 (-) Transcript_5291:1132-1440(-)